MMETPQKTGLFSLFANLLLAAVKAVAGVLGHSHALVADAIESTTDVFSSLLVYWGLRYAEKPPDAKHPYGHGRIEPLISFVIVVFLLVSATLIVSESIRHMQSPHQQSPEAWTLCVLGVIILWKEVAYRIVLRRGTVVDSTTLKADAWHHRIDAFTSLTAFVGIAIALLAGPGFEAADDWAALVAAGIIFYNSYRLFRPAWGDMMDEQRHDALVRDIHRLAIGVEGVENTEKCYVRKSGTRFLVELHARVQASISVRQGHVIAHRLQDEIKAQLPEVAYVLVHIEPAEDCGVHCVEKA